MYVCLLGGGGGGGRGHASTCVCGNFVAVFVSLCFGWGRFGLLCFDLV